MFRAVRNFVVFALLLVIGGGMARGLEDCALPPDFCTRLKPGMVVFIGHEMEEKESDARALWTGQNEVVTFAVDEPLWGLDRATGSVRVHYLWDGYKSSSGPLFIAVSPRTNGDYAWDLCGANPMLPADHKWAQEFRYSLKKLTPANVPVRVVNSGSYSAVPKVVVQLRGEHGTFKGTADNSGKLNFPAVPPGSYRLAATRRNFSLAEGQESVSILPGSCSELLIKMVSASSISGQVIDSTGIPVRNMRWFHLIGWSAAKNAQDYARSHLVETDAEGKFSVDGLVPGQYYLGTNIWQSREPRQAPFPVTYYPGVAERESAVPLVIAAGKSLHSIVFQLPEYGMKRRLTIRAESEDGLPVPHAIVENGPAEIEEVQVSSIGKSQYTDEHGAAVFDVWAASEYSIDVRLVLPNTFHESQPIRIPAGDTATERVVVLKGLRLRESK